MKKLYIIHGWTYNIEAWEEVAKLLKKDGIGAELLRVPGLTEKSNKVWDINGYVEWADRALPDGAVALGHSNGGRILLNLLEKNPSKRKGLILLDSAGIYEESFKRDLMKKGAKLFAPLKSIPALRKLVHKLIGANDYERAPENMKKTLDNMINSDKNLDLSSIKIPIEIIWGKDDMITPLRQGEKLHQLLTNSRITVVDGWNHSPYFTHKDELAKEICKKYKELEVACKKEK